MFSATSWNPRTSLPAKFPPPTTQEWPKILLSPSHMLQRSPKTLRNSNQPRIPGASGPTHPTKRTILFWLPCAHQLFRVPSSFGRTATSTHAQPSTPSSSGCTLPQTHPHPTTKACGPTTDSGIKQPLEVKRIPTCLQLAE